MNKLYIAYFFSEDEEIISASNVEEAKKIVAKKHLLTGEEYVRLRVRLLREGERLYCKDDYLYIDVTGNTPIETDKPSGELDWDETCRYIKSLGRFTWGH
jgi:hypothetical protein